MLRRRTVSAIVCPPLCVVEVNMTGQRSAIWVECVSQDATFAVEWEVVAVTEGGILQVNVGVVGLLCLCDRQRRCTAP